LRARACVVLVLAFGCAKSAPANDPKNVAVGNVDADAGTLETMPSPDSGPTKTEDAIDAGWVTTDYKTGRIDYVGREKALAVMKQGKWLYVVRVVKIIEECSSVGGSHVFVEPAYSKESPFRFAHFGGHGSHVVHSKGALWGDDKQLYVASVETHSPSSFGNGRGWCLEQAPPYDADVLAIIPVRSEGEGMRLLTELAK